MDVLKTEISKLELGPEDILVLKVDGPVSREIYTELQKIMKNNFPNHQVVVLEPGLSLEVVRGQNGK